MSILLLAGTFLSAADKARLPGGSADIDVPPGWTAHNTPALLLRGPSNDPITAPRMIIVQSAATSDAAANSMREGWLRIADGCTVSDDVEVPLGGRVWRQIRVHFATGPLVFAQTAWIGTVDGRTIVAVLSSPEDRMPTHQSVASTALGTISLRR